jgi:transposase-like protein
LKKGVLHEEETVRCRADCCGIEGSRGWHAGCRAIRRIGISEQTFYRWKKQYAGLDSDQARQLKQLQEENERLKKIVAELSLDKAMLADVIKKKW